MRKRMMYSTVNQTQLISRKIQFWGFVQLKEIKDKPLASLNGFYVNGSVGFGLRLERSLVALTIVTGHSEMLDFNCLTTIQNNLYQAQIESPRELSRSVNQLTSFF